MSMLGGGTAVVDVDGGGGGGGGGGATVAATMRDGGVTHVGEASLKCWMRGGGTFVMRV